MSERWAGPLEENATPEGGVYVARVKGVEYKSWYDYDGDTPGRFTSEEEREKYRKWCRDCAEDDLRRYVCVAEAVRGFRRLRNKPEPILATLARLEADWARVDGPEPDEHWRDRTTA